MGQNLSYIRGKYDKEGINNTAYNDYVKKINKRISSVEEAIEQTKKILNIEEIDSQQFSDDFWGTIFTQQDDKDELGCVKLCINTSEPLYSDLMISKSLEAFGSLILDQDIEGMKDSRGRKIRLYNSKEEFDRAEKNEKKNYMLALKNGGENINTADNNQEFAMLMIPKNYKEVKTYDVSNVNVIDKEYGKDYPIIHEYCEGYRVLNEKRKCIKELLSDENTENKDELLKLTKAICRQLGEMKKDINVALKELVRPIIWKQPLKDSGEADYNQFDFFDKKQVRELLKIKKGKNDFQNDLSCILYDLEKLIEKCDFNETHYTILDMLQNGLEPDAIGKVLGKSRQNIKRYMDTIIGKIMNEYEKQYTDWYYLNKVKGTYKKCCRCGEIKLVQEFDVDKNLKSGIKSACKECRKKDYKKK